MTESLPTLQRLALAYCPRSARVPTLGLLLLDARLAHAVRSASEPMLAQIRLAWWRDILAMPSDRWPEGEPLLACLGGWDRETGALTGLVDGWEAMTGQAPLPAEELGRLAGARGTAFGALAALLGNEAERECASRMGRNWALADMTSRLSHVAERDAVCELARTADWRPQRLSRRMRTLAVLHGLAVRSLRRDQPLDALTPSSILPAMRLGLLGM